MNFMRLWKKTGRSRQGKKKTQIILDDPPTYACCGTSDGIASWRTMQRRLQAMSATGIPTEFHKYEGLSHGFGLGTGTLAEGWIDNAIAFWEKQM